MTTFFDPGTPQQQAEILIALERTYQAQTQALQELTDAEFFAPQGSAWSPAEHLRHLRKSVRAVALGLGLPRLLLWLRFGRARGSRSLVEVRDLYLSHLRAGAQAGRFAPTPEPLPVDLAQRRQDILTQFAAAHAELLRAVAGWSETGLDRYRLPHPVLGPLTLREMLFFTLYHNCHHCNRIFERRQPS